LTRYTVPLLALSLGSLLLCARAGQPEPIPAESQVLTVEGKVEVLKSGTTAWDTAQPNQLLRAGDRLRTGKSSRATVRLTDRSVLRVNQRTFFQILPPKDRSKRVLLDLKNGSVYILSRERPEQVHFQTPVVTGAIRGTEFYLGAEEKSETLLTLIDGEVELGSERGRLVLQSGEEASVKKNQPPVKSPALEAINRIQWTLYYPGVLDPAEIGLDARSSAWSPSLEGYRAGNLLQALSRLPAAEPDSEAARIYRAALLLAVGQVEETQALLSGGRPLPRSTGRSSWTVRWATRGLGAASAGFATAMSPAGAKISKPPPRSSRRGPSSAVTSAEPMVNQEKLSSPKRSCGWPRSSIRMIPRRGSIRPC
jgi:hypothetical protein